MGEVQVFVVRVWRRLGLFRAAVQPAEGGPASLFDRPDQLAGYLGGVSDRPTSSTDDGVRPSDAPLFNDNLPGEL